MIEISIVVPVRNESENINHYWQGSDNGALASFDYSVGTISGTDNVISWTDAGLDISAESENTNYSEGTVYYTNVRATDFAGNTSSVMVSDGFQIDATAPAIGIVYDGLEVDQAFTSSGDTLKGSWSGFNDDGSGIEYFLYAITIAIIPTIITMKAI